jgi:hypothetical protein
MLCWWGQQTPLQELLATPLLLQQLHLDCDKEQCARLSALDMASLTQLKQFRCDAVLDDATVLPAQLQRLYLTHRGAFACGFQPVLQLQHLEVTFDQHVRCGKLEELRMYRHRTPVLNTLQDALTRLALLPALQHVKLQYIGTVREAVTPERLAAGTAKAWGQIPQLRELKVQFLHDGAGICHLTRYVQV